MIATSTGGLSTSNGSGHIFREHFFLDCPLQQTRSVPLTSHRLARAVIRSGSRIIRTEFVLWEWLNAFADATTRAVADEGIDGLTPIGALKLFRSTVNSPRLLLICIGAEGTRIGALGIASPSSSWSA
jgi:hypothetical protein